MRAYTFAFIAASYNISTRIGALHDQYTRIFLLLLHGSGGGESHQEIIANSSDVEMRFLFSAFKYFVSQISYGQEDTFEAHSEKIASSDSHAFRLYDTSENAFGKKARGELCSAVFRGSSSTRNASERSCELFLKQYKALMTMRMESLANVHIAQTKQQQKLCILLILSCRYMVSATMPMESWAQAQITKKKSQARQTASKGIPHARRSL